MRNPIVNAKNITTLERIIVALSEVLAGLFSLLLAPFGYAFDVNVQVTMWVLGRMMCRTKRREKAG